MATNPAGVDPYFTVETLSANVNLTAAQTSRTNVTGATKLLTFGAYGGLLKRLGGTPSGALAADTKLMLFRVRPAISATVAHLVRSVKVPAYATDAATTDTPTTAFSFDATTPLRGGPGEELWVGIAAAAANGIEVDAEYENF